MFSTSHLWSPLTSESITELSASKHFDIDYLCIRDHLINIFNSEVFARMVGSCSGQVYRSGHGARLRDGKKTLVYCIGDIAEFKVGLIISETEDKDSDAVIQAVETDGPEPAGMSGQKIAINQLLQEALPGRQPFSRFKVSSSC